MIFKHYTFETIEDIQGVPRVVGSRMVCVPFWRSALWAFEWADKNMDNSKVIINFRRIK